MKKLVLLALVAAIATSVSACGRKGNPVAPDGSSYPRTYPNIESPYPGQVPQSEK